MKISSSVLKALLLPVVILVIGEISVHAQTSADLRAGYEKYWRDDIAFLEKIKSEKDGDKAASLLNQRKDQMLPRLQQLVKQTAEYKKTASGADQQKEEEWVMSNPLHRKDSDMQADMMMHAGEKGGAFPKASGDYMKASMAAIRKAKQ